MSEFFRKALNVIAKHGEITANQFAREMWPNSEGWNRCSNCGSNGARYGAGMFLCGGSYLAKLRYKGFVVRHGEWLNLHSLTSKGYEETKGEPR